MAYKTEKTIKEGIFLDIIPPKLNFFDIKLQQFDEQGYKVTTKEKILLNSHQYYNIEIYCTKLEPEMIVELSNSLKNAFQLPFLPFNKTEQKIHFYTTKFTPIDKQIKILNDTFDSLIQFETNIVPKKDNNLNIFNETKEKISHFENDNFAVRYCEKLDTFMILAKKFLTKDEYIKLASVSHIKGSVNLNPEFKNIFPESQFSKKTVFQISKDKYYLIKDFLVENYTQFNDYQIIQTNFYKQHYEDIIALEYTKKNIIDFHISDNKEKGCFNFYCYAYESKISTRDSNGNFYEAFFPRNSLGLLALNNVLLHEKDDTINKEDEYDGDRDIYGDKIKIKFNNIKKEHRKKNYLIPYTELFKLQKIKHNFIKNEPIFNNTLIKQTHKYDDILDGYTYKLFNKSDELNFRNKETVFFKPSGEAYLLFFFQSNNQKIISQGIKITNTEVDNYLKDEIILNNSIYFNTYSFLPDHEKLDKEKCMEIFSKIKLNYDLYHQTQVKEKKKKIKI